MFLIGEVSRARSQDRAVTTNREKSAAVILVGAWYNRHTDEGPNLN